MAEANASTGAGATGSRPETAKFGGTVGFFDSPETLLRATAEVRDAKVGEFDVFTPYPVHGLDAAQGLKRSPIPYITFLAGATGCGLAFLFQYWTSVIDWPIIIGGKPFNSWPAFVPVMFECTILFAGLATFAAMIGFNRLPNLRRKAFDPGITRDRFAIWIGPGTEESRARKTLEQAGAKGVREVREEGWFT